MLNKPYIHYIDVKVRTTSAGNHWTDILVRQQEIAGLPYNDMFIKMLHEQKGFFCYKGLESLASVHIKDVKVEDSVQQNFSAGKEQRANCSTCAVVASFVLVVHCPLQRCCL
jgi:hypothetical protein